MCRSYDAIGGGGVAESRSYPCPGASSFGRSWGGPPHSIKRFVVVSTHFVYWAWLAVCPEVPSPITRPICEFLPANKASCARHYLDGGTFWTRRGPGSASRPRMSSRSDIPIPAAAQARPPQTAVPCARGQGEGPRSSSFRIHAIHPLHLRSRFLVCSRTPNCWVAERLVRVVHRVVRLNGVGPQISSAVNSRTHHGPISQFQSAET